MRRISFFLAVAAIAALTLTALSASVQSASAASTLYNWTGFYAGVNAGYGWNNHSVDLTGDASPGAGSRILNTAFGINSTNAMPYSPSLDANGFVGGGQLGYNWQFARSWVAGLEADIQYSAVRGDFAVAGTVPGISYQLSVEQRLNWFGTVRGRLGVLVTERILLFGTAGLVYGRTEANANIANLRPLLINEAFNTTLNCPASQVCIAGSNSKISTGWTAGGGVEWAMWSKTTLKIEYLHIDLGDQSVTLTAQSPATGNGFATAKITNNFDIVRAGLNFRF